MSTTVVNPNMHGVRLLKDNLALHLDAASINSYPGSGTTWYDISGNNRNFTWNSVSYTSGSNAYFSTSGRRCRGPASNSFGINNTSGYTIYLIFQQPTLVSTAAFQFYGDVSYSRGIFSHCTWSDNYIYFDQGGCCDAAQRTYAQSGGVTDWSIVTFWSSVSQRQIFKNNSSLATNNTSAANINLNSTQVDLGSSADYGGDSSTWDGRISQFIVYNRALTTAEMNYNYEYLRTRYSL